MKKQFKMPGTSCEQCGQTQNLEVKTKWLKLQGLTLKCPNCQHEEDLINESLEFYEAKKKELKKTIKRITKTLLELKKTLPKDKSDWINVIKDPTHPFTATLITGLVLLMMEASGIGVFIAISWILGNLILTPVGWVLIPLVVGIGLYYGRTIKKEKVKNLYHIKKKLNISDEDFIKLLPIGLLDEEAFTERINKLKSNDDKLRIKLIKDEQHRKFLIDAINNAKKEVFIASGWISEKALDDEFCQAMRNALERGVNFFIVYGWENVQGKHYVSQVALNKLENCDNNTPGKIHLKKISTHQKILIKDDDYHFIGSNNWLSNTSFRNKETSYCLVSEKATKAAKKKLFEEYGFLKRG